MKLFLLSSLCFCLISSTQCYNILVVFSVDGYSHHILGESLAKGLSNAGHNVTFLSPKEVKNPGNMKVIRTNNQVFKKYKKANLLKYENLGIIFPLLFNRVDRQISEHFFNDKEVQKLLYSNATFDAVILEQWHNNAKKYLAHHFKCPLIMYSPCVSNKRINRLVGNPEPPSYVSDLLLNYSGHDMSFVDRAYNFIFGLYQLFTLNVVSDSIQSSVIKKHFPNAPSFEEINSNISLVLLNSHVSFNQAVPRVPNMIDIGGYHIAPEKPLPQNLQEFIGTAEEGVIYFSMGSFLQLPMMPNNTKNIIIKVLSSRKEKVLLKWDAHNLENVSSNIMISNWFPQNDILAHPNIKLFITHCGQLSLTEIMHYGVPILSLPILSDQKINAAQAESMGVGKTLSFSKITEENFSNTLNELLDNDKYFKNAKARSKIMRDRPMKPLETAIYWIEYVIRNGGAPHLRVAGAHLPFYKYFCLDVIAVLVIFLLIFTRYLFKTIKYYVGLLFKFTKGNYSVFDMAIFYLSGVIMAYFFYISSTFFNNFFVDFI